MASAWRRARGCCFLEAPVQVDRKPSTLSIWYDRDVHCDYLLTSDVNINHVIKWRENVSHLYLLLHIFHILQWKWCPAAPAGEILPGPNWEKNKNRKHHENISACKTSLKGPFTKTSPLPSFITPEVNNDLIFRSILIFFLFIRTNIILKRNVQMEVRHWCLKRWKWDGCLIPSSVGTRHSKSVPW